MDQEAPQKSLSSIDFLTEGNTDSPLDSSELELMSTTVSAGTENEMETNQESNYSTPSTTYSPVLRPHPPAMILSTLGAFLNENRRVIKLMIFWIKLQNNLN
ncbi:hypothetical protein ABEB36_014970 [Hypothenemus hampei]|uniref:Uncharacterized protein n=1 Tax=Hypothenemus hampei TaxID=57062 RepID=A0ABD1E1Q0_HYPHA